jgi:o-succinylbenzoate synthase
VSAALQSEAVRVFSWRPFAIPFRRPLVAAHGRTERREGVVVRLESKDGLIGLGEASPLESYSGGSIADVMPALEWLCATLAGGSTSADDEALAATTSLGAWRAVMCAMETARESIAAARAGVPLWRSLHPGVRVPPGVSAVDVPVNALIGDCDPDAAVESALGLIRDGYRTLKLKAGLGRERDLDRLAAVRKAIGPFIGLRLDPNGAWSPADAAVLLAAAEQYVVQLVEQPLPDGPDALAQLADLAQQFPSVRLGADESCRTPEDVETIIRLGAPMAIVVKPMVSGLADAALMLRTAEQGGIPAVVTTTMDAGVGTMAAMHLAATLTEPPACGLATRDLLEGDIVTGVPEVEDGRIRLWSVPGLGASIDEPALDRYATGPWRTVEA